MNRADVLLLFEYNYWANDRVLAASSRVSREQFLAPAAVSFGSLRGTLVHALSTESLWRTRMQDVASPVAGLREDDFESLEALIERWREEESTMRRFLDTLRDEDMNKPVNYTTTRGVPHSNILWQLLCHIVNHGTQFRSEAGVLLTQYGQSPGDLDLIVFLRQRA